MIVKQLCSSISFKVIFSLLLVLLISGCSTIPKKNSNDLLNLRTEADEKYNNKDYKNSLPLYIKLAETVKSDAALWFRLGNVQAHLKLMNQAIKSYELAVQFDSEFSMAWHNMGLIQLRQTANSFTQMLQMIKPNDPLYPRALFLAEGTLKLLSKKIADEQSSSN